MNITSKDRSVHNKECSEKLINIVHGSGYTSINYYREMYIADLNRFILEAGYHRNYIAYEMDRASIRLTLKKNITIPNETLNKTYAEYCDSLIEMLKDFYLKQMFANKEGE